MTNKSLLNTMADDSSSQQIDLIIHYGTCGKSGFLNMTREIFTDSCNCIFQTQRHFN